VLADIPDERVGDRNGSRAVGDLRDLEVAHLRAIEGGRLPSRRRRGGGSGACRKHRREGGAGGGSNGASWRVAWRHGVHGVSSFTVRTGGRCGFAPLGFFVFDAASPEVVQA